MPNTLSTPDDGKNAVNPSLTTPTPRKTVENKDFAAFARRIVRAHSKRVASGDVEALSDLVALAAAIDQATTDAVIGLREFGYSWAEIANRLGISKQAAQQRWGVPTSQRSAKPGALAQDPLPGFDNPPPSGGV